MICLFVVVLDRFLDFHIINIKGFVIYFSLMFLYNTAQEFVFFGWFSIIFELRDLWMLSFFNILIGTDDLIISETMIFQK